ncbi:uncharacterized protein LOC104898647 isoform X2 [Beta vulgaris subsp. vulgaris]|uniref:uncharacterized protein LOC104898647 isoform X2 n=1 Tax=Beta vulgaris subsp. vulgaris TaxID=3555 RepID=UPI0020375556|nr:uncharacterized protein LOC104898647 isoform X2 [Beta vulgaris subsp. vulgaris]
MNDLGPARLPLLPCLRDGPVKSLKPILKLLYSLICSCLSYEVCQGNRDINAARNSFKLEFEEIVTVSASLFKELHERLLCCSDDASVDLDVGLDITRVDGEDSREELLLLLRCCILMVRLHPYDQILTKQFQVVVALLRKLCLQSLLTSKERGLIKLNKPISSHRICGSCTNSSSLNSSVQSSDLYLCFLQKMLEVYLDEVFVDQPFRECIAISTSSTHHSLSLYSSIQIEIVLEVIAAHFLMSISGKDHVLQTFTESLIWTEKRVLSSPEVSLAVASSLINHPVMTSSPILLLSHLISLVSEVIGICVFPEKGGPKVRFVNIYLSTFHDSVNLYCEHMSKLMTGSCSSRRTVLRPFNSHFQSEIHDRFNLMHVDLDNAWRKQSSSMFKKTIYSMAVDAISYLKMNLCIVDDTSRDDVFSILSSLISRLISVEIDEVLLQKFKEITMQDFCLLASILKLMSSSLLQASCCFDKKSCLAALFKRKDALPGYSSLAGLMSFFVQYNFRIPIQVQQFIVDALKPHLSTYEELEFMLVHFAGFLLLCIVGGMHILMRGCLSFMLVLLNTLALESRTESPTCVVPQATVSGSVAGSSNSFGRSQTTSSLRVASNFRRERRKLLREVTAPEVSEISDEETCNGELYLRCLLKNREEISELADFIECKPWRDYNARLMYKAKTQRRRFQESGRRLRLAKSSFRSGSKRKLKRKGCSSIKYL